MLNQSLLDALLCFRRVVVPTARCFSSDSYAGSVISRSTDSAGRSRSQSTASRVERSKPPVTTDSWGMKRNASFYADAIVSSTIDREGHKRKLPTSNYQVPRWELEVGGWELVVGNWELKS